MLAEALAGLLREIFGLSPKQYGKLSVTIRGEEVKSHGEQAIADFLSRNGIRYEYERPIEVGIWIFNEELCKPDFYLPDYDVYVEYWGMLHAEEGSTRNGYRAKMAWKFEQYKRYNVKVVSIYPNNLRNLDWVFRKRFYAVTGQNLPGRRQTSSRRSADVGVSPVIVKFRNHEQRDTTELDQPTLTGPACPECGSEMVMRRAKRGANAGKQFWGCSQWPKSKCRGIINL